MKLKLSKEVTAGLIVVLIGVTMYWLVYFLKGKDIFNTYTQYRIEYQSVEGVSATSPIYIRGLKIGSIKEINYNSQRDLFDVTIQLESKYSIPANSVAQIYSADLLGTKAIRINMGNSLSILGNNDLIQSEIATDILSYLSSELPTIKNQIATVLNGLDTSVKHLNTILGSNNRENLESALSHLSETLLHFHSLGAWINNETPQIHTIIENLNQLSAALSVSSKDIQSTLSNLNSFSDSLKQANIANAIRNFDLLIHQIQDPNGSMGKLLYSDEVHNNLSHLLQNLDSLVTGISQNPKRYFRISVF